MDQIVRRLTVAAALSAAVTLGFSPVAAAEPTAGVGDASSYTGGSTSSVCQHNCTSATLGVGGPSSYSGGASANHPGGSATQGVGGVNSYTGDATSGTAHNGTNATTRTGNYGPGH
jgi:hypothetical protein